MRSQVVRRLIVPIVVCLLTSLVAVSPVGAETSDASPLVSLKMAFSPPTLGSGTTLHFDINVGRARSRLAPPATTRISLLYPASIGIATSGLGIDSCDREQLQRWGVRACPRDSRIGLGRALVAIPIGRQLIRERATVSIFSGNVHGGRITLLFHIEATSPIWATFVFTGTILPAPPPFGGRILLKVPLIPALSDTQFVALRQFSGTIGPENLIYHRTVKGATVAYAPEGVLLPSICPRNGFQFGARLTWQDRTQSLARATVDCSAVQAR